MKKKWKNVDMIQLSGCVNYILNLEKVFYNSADLYLWMLEFSFPILALPFNFCLETS